jgi:hypothetical protein
MQSRFCGVNIRLPESEIAGFDECANASGALSSGSRGKRSREPLPPFAPLSSPIPVGAKPPGQIERLVGFQGERGI